ncbi:MAG: hypothetical protein AB7F89_17730 [Pirellulaceae bacterium]
MLAPIVRIMHVRAAGGFVLLSASATALIAAKSQSGDRYHDTCETPVR